MNGNLMKRIVSLLLCTVLLAGNLPAVAWATETEVPTGAPTELVDLDREAADAVAARIAELPALEEIKGMGLDAQAADYAKVQSAYSAYDALTDAQKTLLPPAEEVFKPYFDYFNAQTQEAGIIASGRNNKIDWVLDDAGTLTLTGTGSMNIWGSTDSPWYDYRASVKKAVIGSGITEIRSYQFYDCYNMTSVSIPGTVTEISWGAFENCKSLTGITLPSGITEIHNWSFRNCQSLAEITIPSGVTRIGQEAFYGCYSMSSVSIPSTVTEIGSQAFFDCEKLTSIQLPAGLTTIASGTFYYCRGLTSITIPSKVTAIEGEAFRFCESLKSVTMPSGVTSIGRLAFEGCEALTSVSLPSTLTTIGDNAFESCTGLTSITIPKSVTSMGKNPFRLCSKLSTISVASGSTSFRVSSGVLYTYDYSKLITVPNTKTGSYTVNSNTTTIGAGAFTANQLTSISLPSSLTTIENGAFSRSVNLTKITIPSAVTKLETYTFYNCQKLSSITLPATLTTLDEQVFTGCKTLTSITIPKNVSQIGGYCFMGCTVLKDITFTGSAPSFKTYTFYGVTGNCYYPASNTSWTDEVKQNYGGKITWVPVHTIVAEGTCGDNLTWTLDETGKLTISGTGPMTSSPWTSTHSEAIRSVVIESGVTSIAEKAFSGCANLQSVTLPVGLTKIDNYAFEGCSSLQSMVLPEGLVSLGDMVFRNCVAMTTVILPDSVTTVGRFLFTNCSALREIKIPAGLTEIADGMFDLCAALETITIPEAVRSIGEYAFYYCEGLKQIIFEGDLDTIHRKAFAGVTATAYYPREYEGWTADTLKNYSGTITWKAYCREQHLFDQEVAADEYLVSEATCKAKAIYYKSCVCGETGTETFEYGKLKQHEHTDLVTPPTCTKDGYTTHTCGNCGDTYTDSPVGKLGHDMGQWTSSDVAGEERRDCSRCDHFETRSVEYQGNVLTLEGEDLLGQNTVWINGLPYPVEGEGENRYVALPGEEDCLMVTYTYHVGDAADVHTQYPTGMKVYRVTGGDTGFKAEHIPELDNLLQYSGSSIRITGKKGIRMITSLTKGNKAALTGKGLGGYKLLEYGTALCWASEIAAGDALVLGRPFTRSNYAYKKGVADPVFATSGNLIQYTNVLVGFTNDQCKDDIAMRPYIILEDAQGNQVTLYGGTIYRSIGYIAYQNRSVFKPGTGSYKFVWDIIHHVYGDKYDAEYKG